MIQFSDSFQLLSFFNSYSENKQSEQAEYDFFPENVFTDDSHHDYLTLNQLTFSLILTCVWPVQFVKEGQAVFFGSR